MMGRNGTRVLKAVIPESIEKIKKQIEILKCALKQDITDKDKEIYTQALNALQEALEALEAVENTPSNAGRPKAAEYKLIQEYKKQGMTQEQVARLLNVSISTVRRNWKLREIG